MKGVLLSNDAAVLKIILKLIERLKECGIVVYVSITNVSDINNSTLWNVNTKQNTNQTPPKGKP